MQWKTLWRWGLVLIMAVAVIAIGLALYTPSRPHLAHPDQTTRRNHIQSEADRPSDEDDPNRRATVAALREFFLDYPEAHEPALRLKLAEAIASGPDADYEFVADQVEQIAQEVLTKSPTLEAFGATGMDLRKNDHWTEGFFSADVDGDGSKDVVLAHPETAVCFLFRHTAQGWKSHRMVVGAQIMGVWVFEVQKGGPKVIEVATLADSVYDPNLFVDAFAWQQGRVVNVLSTKISHGFKLDHQDVDGKGVQAIRLFGNETAEQVMDWQHKADKVQVYRWDGKRFTQRGTPSAPSIEEASWLEQGRRLFEAGKFQEAAQALQRGINAPPKAEDYSRDWEVHQGWYTLGLCRAFLGDREGAMNAMAQAAKKVSSESDVRSEYASLFLSVCSSPAEMPRALAAIGQGLRVLEQAALTHPQAAPKAVLDASGLNVDSYQDLTLNGQPGGVGQFHWRGGSAVVALAHSGQEQKWEVWPLAYALDKPLPEEAGWMTPRELFYLSHPPAVQLHPPPTKATLGQVTGGANPQIVLHYDQNGASHESRLQWNGSRFALVGPQSVAKEDLFAERNRLLEALYQQHDYRASLDALTAFEGRIRSSGKSDAEKTQLLLEVFYHEALCYRKLGDEGRAAVTYAALARGHGQDAWGLLAKQWLREN